MKKNLKNQKTASNKSIRGVKLLRKIKTLSQDYKRHKRLLHGLPITAVILIIIAIVFMVKIPQVWWVGLLQIGLAIFGIVLYIIGLAYYNYKIEKLEKEEALKEEKVKKAEELEKEMTEKDERIKELEEELKKSKNSKQ